MRTKGLRLALFVAALLLLARVMFWTADTWTVVGFFACGALWYWLTWRKTRELDSPRPR